MKLKTFPNSYPYLNKHGVSFSKRDLEITARFILKSFGENARNKGLELSLIILWAMGECDNEETFLGLVASSFARSARWSSRNDLKFSLYGELYEDEIDKTLLESDKTVLNLIDFERLLESEPKAALALTQGSKDAKYRAIKKLQEKWNGKNDV